jgi:DNA-directed RNA polymerase subunit RPC12/RpoP
MKYCGQCGAQIEDEILQVRCPQCGHKLLTKEEEHQVMQEENQTENTGSKKLWYIVGGIAAIIVILLCLLVGIQNSGSSSKKKLYGEWVTDNGALSMTFQEDGTLRIGAGAGLLGADAFTYEIVDDNTLQFQVEADGIVGQIADLFSIEVDYAVEGDELKITLFETDYLLHKKE